MMYICDGYEECIHDIENDCPHKLPHMHDKHCDQYDLWCDVRKSRCLQIQLVTNIDNPPGH